MEVQSMQRAQHGILVAFVMALLAAPAARSQGFALRDPIVPDIASIQQAGASEGARTSAAPLASRSRVSLTRSAPAVPRALPGVARGGVLVDTISLRQELLQAPATFGQAAGVAGEIAGFASAATTTDILTLTIEGRSYELSYVSHAIDPKVVMRHVTLQVLGSPASYARFSISGNGFIVGTLHTPRATYRIVPVDATTQNVYRVRSDGSASSLRYQRVAREIAGQIGDLERRHVQLERLADIRPEFSIGSDTGGTLNIKGGRLGKMARGKATAAAVLAALEPQSVLTRAPAGLEVRIKRESGSGPAKRIEFEQVINGIPVLQRNLINLAGDGTIREIRTAFVAPARVQSLPMISEQRALQHAVAALEEKFRARIEEVELVKPTELYYDVRPFEEHLVPEYRFSIDTAAHDSWIVRVNAYTGESEIGDPRYYADALGYRVCRDNGTGSGPLTCSDPGAVVIWNNPFGGAANCPFAAPMSGSVCTTLDPARAHSALLHADDVLKQIDAANPDYCCDLLGGADHSIDLVYKTRGTTLEGAYSIFTQSLVSAPTSNLFESVDVIWHELGHHYLDMYNPGLFSLPPAGQRFANAFHEAFSDVLSASIALNQSPGLEALYGEPWVMGDGDHGPGAGRDLRVDQLFTRLNDFSLSVHDRGLAIGNYFYRVKNASGMTNRRLLDLILNVGDRLQDYDGNGLDVLDFKTAVLNSVSPSETALLSAVNSVFTAMAQVPGGGPPPNPPGQPAPPGTPATPFPLQAAWIGCSILSNGQGVTNWGLNWPGVSGASNYVAYLQSLSSPWIFDAAVTPNTSIDAYIAGDGHQAVTFVAACNGNGCSNVSNPAGIAMLPQCFH